MYRFRALRVLPVVMMVGCAAETPLAPEHPDLKSARIPDAVNLVGTFVYSSLSAGDIHSCLRKFTVATGGVSLLCWGNNVVGQLGTGGGPTALTPTPVATSLPMVSVGAGLRHSCGLANGDAYCWGMNNYGQLGDGTSGNRTVPRRVVGGIKFSSISVGREHVCGLTSAGVAYCWGRGGEGQLGTGNRANVLQPTPVNTPATWTQISAGSFHTCALRTISGEIFCWGDNSFGQLGTGDFNPGLLPRKPNLNKGYLFVVAGGYHTCMLDASRLAWCWGRDRYGEVGSNDGLRLPQPSEHNEINPIRVKGGIAYSVISTGFEHTCGIRASDGTAYCWGRGTEGQLGNGSFLVNNLVPLPVNTSLRFDAITAGSFHTMARSTNTSVWSWGRNASGVLGNGNQVDTPLPVQTLP